MTKSQLILYNQLPVKPIIEYGVLSCGCTSNTTLQTIHSLQKKLLKYISFLPRYASVESLMIQYTIASAYELHVSELFKFIVVCLRKDHSVEQFNNIQETSRHVHLQSGSRVALPTSKTEKSQRYFTRRVPGLL